MTREEAARLLDPETTWYELWKHEEEMSLAACNEACRMGADALRAQQERENPKPLTLDELRKMDGEPVWIDDLDEGFHGWELSSDASDYFEGESRTVESYGTRWVAYRYKPKGGMYD